LGNQLKVASGTLVAIADIAGWQPAGRRGIEAFVGVQLFGLFYRFSAPPLPWT
jgi:hypothetical protein